MTAQSVGPEPSPPAAGAWHLYGLDGEADVDAAVRFLRDRADVDDEGIGGLGLSVGGEMVLAAAARNPDPRAVVSEGAGVRSLAEHLHTPGVAVQRWLTPWLQQTAAVAVLASTSRHSARDKPGDYGVHRGPTIPQLGPARAQISQGAVEPPEHGRSPEAPVTPPGVGIDVAPDDQKLGYCVRRGEKALRIFAPCPPSKARLQAWRDAGADPADKPPTYFRLTAVFETLSRDRRQRAQPCRSNP